MFTLDQLLAILAALPDLQHAKVMAERIRQQAAATFKTLDIAGPNATISIGLSEFYPEDTSFEEALDRADNALYRAKEQGRNQVIML